jgi:pimeloyl-ACP methyl ester carboxylesterase
LEERVTTDRTTPNVASGFADVAGTRLYWEEQGQGEPLLLVHAGIADSSMWDAQFEAFAPHYRVIRFDARGFGRSEFGTGPFSYRGDIVALLDALDVDRAHLVGISFGGATALEVAIDSPDRVRSLVMGASSPPGLVEHTNLIPLWEEVDRLVAAGQIDDANELEVQMWVDGPIRSSDAVDPEIRKHVLEMNRPLLAAPEQPAQDALTPPAAERLDQVQAPTLLIAGEYDQPSQIAGPTLLADRIPGAELLTLHGAAHMLNMEQPDAFNAAVLDFLQRRGTSAG